MPAPHLHLLCHIERIGPSYGTDYSYFSLNLTVGLAAADGLTRDQIKELLQPWQWKTWDWRQDAPAGTSPPGLAVWGFTPSWDAQTNTWQQQGAVALKWEPVKAQVNFIEEWNASPNNSGLPSISQALEEAFDACWPVPTESMPETLVWNPATGKETIEVENLPYGGRTQVPWRATLAQVWSEPQPVPLSLRLAVFLRIDNAAITTAGVTHLVAAPRFPGTGAPTPEAAVPSSGILGGPAPQPDLPNQLDYEWPYVREDGSSLTNLQITAHLEPAVIEVVSSSSSFINLKTLLVEVPNEILADAEAQVEHWQQRLPAVLTDAFDLPRLVLDAAREALEVGTAAVNSTIQQLSVSVLSALHDRAHAGALRPPDGQSLAAAFVRELLPAAFSLSPDGKQALKVNSALSQLVEEWLISHSPDLLAWKEMLEATVPVSKIKQLKAAEDHLDVEEKDQIHNLLAALEGVVQAVSERHTLEKLICKQWINAFDSLGLPPELVQFWGDTGADKLKAYLARIDVDVVRYITQGCTQVTWRRLPGLDGTSASGIQALNSGKDAATHIAYELQAYVQGRCSDAPDSLYQAYQPPLSIKWSDSEPILAAAIAKRTASVCTTYVRPASPTDPDRSRSAFAAEPEGLVFQVDHTKRDVADTPHDRSDVVRRVAGTFLLLRRNRTGSAPWYCANYARLGNAPELGNLLVPNGYGYSDEVRQAVLTYRNRPFGVPSVEDNITNQVQVAEGAVAGDHSPLLNYQAAYTGASGAPLLPPLGYGYRYDGVLGVVSTAGALPAELADVDNGSPVPWLLKSLSTVIIGTAIQPREFLRRQPIGHLVTMQLPKGFTGAVSSQQRQGVGLKPPVFRLPPNVSPLARAVPSIDKEGAAMVVFLPGPNKNNPWKPDFAATNQFTFAIFRPSVPLETWKRWTTSDDTDLGSRDADKRSTRQAVLAAYFHYQQQVDSQTSVLPDITLDDPAVSHLHIAADVMWPTSAIGQSSSLHLAIPFPKPSALDATMPLRMVQWDGIQIVIQAVEATANFQIVPGPTSVTVNVPEGQIWRVQLHPHVARPEAQIKFAAGLLTAAGLPMRDGTGTSAEVLDGGLQFLVEVATTLSLPINPAAVLHESLVLAEGSAANGNAVNEWIEVGFDGRVKDAKSLLSYIHQVETLIQRWRWHGLPLRTEHPGNDENPPIPSADFPFEEYFKTNTTFRERSDALAPYDAVLFATRSSEDYLLSPAQFVYDPQAVDGQQTIHRQPRPPFPGAQYHRIAVRAYHRYQGVMLRNFVYDSRLAAPNIALEQWRRHVYRCSLNQPLPPLVVHALLPLTTEGLSLLVIGEGAYQSQIAGLAEGIEAEVTSVATPDNLGSIAQMGPDPILTTAFMPIELSNLRSKPVMGPVGYTFDTGSSIPSYTRSSYLWQAPIVSDAEGEPLDLTDFFVKVRFRRTIVAAGHVNPDKTPYLASDWTSAFWTRILAPIDKLMLQRTVEGLQVKRLSPIAEVFYDKKASCFRYQDATGGEVLPCPAEPAFGAENAGRIAHVFYALITQRIADALGRADESFYSLELVNSTLPEAQALKLKLPAGFTNPVMRLVEIRFDIKLFDPLKFPRVDEQNTGLFEQLFPKPDQKMPAQLRSSAMVSRITQPIMFR